MRRDQGRLRKGGPVGAGSYMKELWVSGILSSEAQMKRKQEALTVLAFGLKVVLTGVGSQGLLL